MGLIIDSVKEEQAKGFELLLNNTKSKKIEEAHEIATQLAVELELIRGTGDNYIDEAISCLNEAAEYLEPEDEATPEEIKAEERAEQARDYVADIMEGVYKATKVIHGGGN